MPNILSTHIEVDDVKVNVKFRDQGLSPSLRAFGERIDDNPSSLEWAEFYIDFICEIVTEWELEEDDGTPVALTAERLKSLPTYILKSVVLGVSAAFNQNISAERLVTEYLDKHMLVLRQIFNACPSDIQKTILFESDAVLRRNQIVREGLEPTEEDDVLTALNKNAALGKTHVKDLLLFPPIETWDELEELILTHAERGISVAFLVTSIVMMVNDGLIYLADAKENQRKEDNVRLAIQNIENERNSDLPENKAKHDTNIGYFQELLDTSEAHLAESQARLEVWKNITNERLAMPRVLGTWIDCLTP